MPMNTWRFPFRTTSPLLIACFPKSGSTYLAKLLSAATGFRTREAVVSFGHQDQDLCERKLQRLTRPAVIQQHVKGIDHNVAMVKKYGIRPIVLVRNIFDTIVSVDDHIRNEDVRTPTGFVHQEYLRLDFDQRIDYLIRVHLPWYFNFFMSWREAARKVETFPLTYERLFSDVPRTLREILAFYRLSVSDSQINAAIESARGSNTRLNKGVSGRGAQMLSPRHQAAIRELAAAWHVDLRELATIGLAGGEMRKAA